MAEQTTRKTRPFEGKISEEVREHAKAAHKEMLLACRSMLDTVINRMEEHEKKARQA